MIQFISHYTERYSYLDSIRLALRGGCRWVQLRMKEASYDEIKPVAIEAQRLCHDAGATFIIDDHVELVKELPKGLSVMLVFVISHLMKDVGMTSAVFQRQWKRMGMSVISMALRPFRNAAVCMRWK